MPPSGIMLFLKKSVPNRFLVAAEVENENVFTSFCTTLLSDNAEA